MPRIQPVHIRSARSRVEPLTLSKAEALADAVFAKQPNLLGSILVLPRFGVSLSDVDVALKVLFICHESVLEVADVPSITEVQQERCLARITGKARFLEGLDPESIEQAVKDQIQRHSEPYLLAVAYGILAENDLASVRTEAEKHLLLAVLNVVETLSDAINT